MAQSIIDKAKQAANKVFRRAVKELYWTVAYDEDEHNERLAVFYFKPDADDDVVVAKVDETVTRMHGRAADRITRHRKKDG